METRIGLLYDPDRNWLRRVTGGITEAAGQRGWRVDFLEFIPEIFTADHARAIVASYSLNGLITTKTPLAAAICSANLPCVVRGIGKDGPISHYQVGTDSTELGRRAADHLLERRLASYAVFTTASSEMVAGLRKTAGFIERCAEHGVEAAQFKLGPRTEARGQWRLDEQIADLVDFLRPLPKPMGLMAINPTHSLRAIAACREAGLRVPDDVAVICGGEDDALFDHLRPSITGFQENQRVVGRTAVEVIEAVHRGEHPPHRRLIPPLMVNARQSTDVLAVDDDDVRAAVRFIWDHVADGIGIEDVLGHVNLSRSTLRRRFAEATGRNPGEEIRRSRIETARRLLTTTDLPLAHVAAAAGYTLPSVLSQEVRKATGQSPTQLRRQYQQLG